MKKEICHVCKKEKKPYIVFMKNDIFSFMQYKQAREDGPICKRWDHFHAMTGEFKNATKEEFALAKKACEFARSMLKWWEKDKKINVDEDNINSREWEGTSEIAKWYREEFQEDKK